MNNVHVEYQRMLVSPEVAEALLSSGAGNRAVKSSLVKKYARAMDRGMWRADHKWPLGFTPDMRLVDGQHRLHAVIEHGKAVEFFADKTLSEIDRKIIGGGKPHNAADELSAMGNPDDVNVLIAQAVYAWIYRAECGNIWDPSMVPTVEELMDVRERHPGSTESILWVVDGTPKFLRQASVAFIRYVASESNRAVAIPFFDRARDGIGMEDGDPALALTRSLADCTTGRKRAPARTIAAIVALAWRAESEGRRLKRVCFRPNKDGMPPVTGIDSILGVRA